MFGIREPLCKPLTSCQKLLLDEINSRISLARLKEGVINLPAPRNQLHSKEAMLKAGSMIYESFNQAGWTAKYHSFELQNAAGYLDYDVDGFPAGAKPTIYPH